MLLQMPLAAASGLQSAFDKLMPKGAALAVNEPGRYQSGARNAFIAGGLEMRFPRQVQSAQLFSFTPPSGIVAGCNGISAHFGGFSFISGKEFEQMVKGIASGVALGFVTMITLKSLCPMCADVVTTLKNAAQMAARLSIDSCKLGQEAYKKYKGEPNTFSDTLCGAETSDKGMATDFFASINGACKSIAGASKATAEAAGVGTGTGAKDKAQQLEFGCVLGTGNVTWGTLGGATGERASTTSDEDYIRKIITMNMMGAVLRHGEKSMTCETEKSGVLKTEDATGKTQIYCPPVVSAKDITGAYMCGTNAEALATSGGAAAKSYCSTFFEATADTPDGSASFKGVTKKKILMCADGDKTNCTDLVLKDFASAEIATGKGFLVKVSEILQRAVNNVRNDTPMDEETMALIQAAPYPLYQAINAAAVYPVAAADLLDSISILVAESAVSTMMEENLRYEGRGEGTPACTSEEQIKRVLETLATATAENRNRRSLMAQNIAVQQGLKEQIRQINLAIQQQVMSPDLLMQNAMAAALTKSTNSSVPRNPPAAASE